ncbi:MAG: QueT transporter family protein [Clostridia bacterium]|nr:QueT transporter family protein [Clostridia bacterium]
MENKTLKEKTIRFIVIFLLSGVAFFLFTMPFREILSVFTVSEVRPAAVLNPLLGISFGYPAALGITVANFIADAYSGYPVAVLIEGIIPQFLYCIVPYYMWRALTKGEEHKHRLNNVERVVKFALVILVYAVISAIGVGAIVQANFGADFLNCAVFVFFNNFDVGILLGCPLMIAFNQAISRQRNHDRKLSVNEIIILVAAAVEAIAITILIIAVYSNGTTLGTYDIWNTIYYYLLALVNAILAITLVVMYVFEKKKVEHQI